MKTRILVTAFGLLLTAGVAHAQPADNQEEAQAFFAKGETALNLGRYEEAADWYIKAYEAWPAPEFLYNIAQSYRLGGNCKESLHFYKRFKKLKEKDTEAPLSESKLAKINDFITSLEKCVKEQEDAAAQQPDGTDDPNNKNPDGNPDGKDPDDKDVAVVEDPEVEDPEEIEDGTVIGAKTVSAHAGFGLALVSTGPQDVPVQGSFFVSAGYPLAAGPATLDVGVGLGYTPLPYRTTMDVSEVASLTSFLVNAGVTYPVNDKIGVRGDLGLGVQTFGNLVAGNPFTVGGQPTTGTLGLFNVRFAVAAEYSITPNIAATVTPFSVSLSPKKDGMESGVTAIDFLVGVGYRM